MRDDFTERTKRILALRVANRCSNPLCRKMTSGPAAQIDESVNIGEAAHIAAAAPGGKRYDPQMTSAQRSSIENGIWLCRTCAALIDRDESTYTAELLHEWKDTAENEARKEQRSYNRYNIFEEDRDLLEAYSIFFNRPAFMDDIFSEGNMEHMKKAIADTAYALNTGISRDREGRIIVQTKGYTSLNNKSWQKKIEDVVQKLYALEKCLSYGEDRGLFRQAQSNSEYCWYIFNDSKFAMEINDLRKQILDKFSEVLKDAGLPTIEFRRRSYK